MGKKEYNKALQYYETGIKVAPSFSSNYYWAARIYLGSSEEVWGMIYGELFMNLERNSKRTKEISELLYNTYKSEIKIISDTSYSVSFSKNNTVYISLDDLKDTSKMFKKLLPYGTGIYEPTLMMATVGVHSIDINSLDIVRKNFLDAYFTSGNNKKYPVVLFDFQKQIESAGHLEAYNHWILMKGDEDAFDKWKTGNKQKYDDFITWFTDNKIKLDAEHLFYRDQF